MTKAKGNSAESGRFIRVNENRQAPFWRLIACLSTIVLLQIVSVPAPVMQQSFRRTQPWN